MFKIFHIVRKIRLDVTNLTTMPVMYRVSRSLLMRNLRSVP